MDQVAQVMPNHNAPTFRLEIFLRIYLLQEGDRTFS